MRRVFFHISLLIAAVILVASCSAEQENAHATQIARIEQYIQKEMEKDPVLFYATNGDTFRLTRTAGEGKMLAPGDTLLFIYTGYGFSSYTFRDSDIFVTNDVDMDWKVTDSTLVESAPAKIALGEDHVLEGLRLGLEGIKAGEVCEILFPSALGLGRTQVGTIPANSPLAYKVKAVSIIEKKR